MLIVFLEFIAVSPLEFGPFVRIMAKPLAKFRTRGDLLQPQVDSGFLLRQTAGPEPVDKNALSVGFFSGFS
jgi:hypothetical protein